MLTYQDLIAATDGETKKMDFIRSAIEDHINSDMYKTAVIAQDYAKKRNTTIVNYQKTITTLTGQVVPDKYSANHKVTSGFFKRFVTQQNQFLLGNGVSWGKEETSDKVGDRFDTQLQKAGKFALIDSVSFGFWNLNRMEVFRVTEFVPLFDEENGNLRAGIRWWQIDKSKPLRATLYEEDGYTEYRWSNRDNQEKGEVLVQKKAYIIETVQTDIDGVTNMNGKNYVGLPIVPLWANEEHQSELVGIREGIDAYDLIKNGFENDLDSAQLYWIIKGAGGMQDPDLAQFLERLKFTRAAAPADGQEVEAVTVDIPHEAREKLLDRIRKDLYEDYMALDTKELASSNATATQIRAAYEPMNSKADEYEYQVLEFLSAILRLAGIDDKPTFTRSYMVNAQEEVTTVVSAASYLENDYVTEKILTLLGDGDKAEEMIKQMNADEIERLSDIDEQTPSEEEV